MSEVGIILTVYNSGEFLAQALTSVFRQTHRDWTLYVMDDGSTDNEVHELLYACDHHSKCQVYRFNPTNEDRRATARYATLINAAVNREFEHKYVTYLAGDDWYEFDRLERMLAVMKEDPTTEVVYGAQNMWRDGKIFGVRYVLPEGTDPWQRVDLNSVMHTLDSFQQVGGWPTDPEFWRTADAEMWRSMFRSGYRFVPVPGPPTDNKRYRADSVDERCIAGLDPWT